MADTPQTVIVSKKAEEALILYASSAQNLMTNQYSIRQSLEEIDRYYMRETDTTSVNLRSRLANRLGNKKPIQNVTVPVVMPQVETALGYLTNVFVTGYPIFGVAGDPATEDAALQMETIMAENAITARWARQLIMFFRDGLKYNLHGLEVCWEERPAVNIETNVAFPNSAQTKQVLWKGNYLRRLDMYNTFMDPRVHPAEIHELGEFAGYTKIYSRIQMKDFINKLSAKIPKATIIRAFQSETPSVSVSNSGSPFQYYIPIINPLATMSGQQQFVFDWMSWATTAASKNVSGIRYGNVYQVTTLYARILPSDFDIQVPSENTPQVWKVIIVNNSVVLYAEKLSNAHGYIPMFFGQPIEDGLDYQTKSFAQNVMDMQDISSSMWNGYMASKRRLVGDRVLYDPMRIREQDINSTDPTAKIPVRNSAYGKPVGEAVYQFPFHDEQTASLVQGAEVVSKMADKINGQNAAGQGQFVKGNKTRFEYQDTMGHSNDHGQIMGISIETQVFTPVKEALKLNVLQYQSEETLYNRDQQKPVKIDPVTLRKAAVHFKVSDGMLPEDKMLATEEFQVAMQTLGSTPAIASGYNMAQLFTYVMKLRGADLRPFEKSPLQMQFEQQTQAWQQAAALAIQKGQEFKVPMPEMPPELKAELQGKQAGGGKTPEGAALESTQG